MADYNFQTYHRGRKNTNRLDNDIWFHNPYLPDVLLNEYYIPFDQTSEGTFKTLGVTLSALNHYNDASYQMKGREILYRAIKVLILRKRLLASWIEGGNNIFF